MSELEKVRCDGHDELMRLVGANTQATQSHSAQIAEVFGLLREVATVIDKNAVRAEARDEALKGLDRKIENGLRADIQKTREAVNQIMACLESRKRKREAEATSGWRGAVTRGWKMFIDRIVLIALVLGLWWILWSFTRIEIFREGPEWILRLFGAK